MTTKTGFYAAALSLIFNLASAQDVHLHVNDRWEECSFQLDPSLSRKEWREFAQEAGMVACLRPITSAKPMGKGRFEVSVLQCKTTIDETKGAWNNTFVHPHDEHYLVGGPALPFPGLTLRAGLTSRLDVGLYGNWRPGANYGFMGAQLQYNILNAAKHKIDLTSRLGVNVLRGPEDMDFAISAFDIVAGKTFSLYKSWLTLSPYAGGSVYLSYAHEKTDRVNLPDQNEPGLQGMVGAVLAIRNVNIAAEYNLAKVNTVSLRLGYNFKLWSEKSNKAKAQS